jgi:hypothetical protein
MYGKEGKPEDEAKRMKTRASPLLNGVARDNVEFSQEQMLDFCESTVV